MAVRPRSDPVHEEPAWRAERDFHRLEAGGAPALGTARSSATLAPPRRLHGIGRPVRTVADWCGEGGALKPLWLRVCVGIRVSRRPVSMSRLGRFKSLFPLHLAVKAPGSPGVFVSVVSRGSSLFHFEPKDAFAGTFSVGPRRPPPRRLHHFATRSGIGPKAFMSRASPNAPSGRQRCAKVRSTASDERYLDPTFAKAGAREVREIVRLLSIVPFESPSVDG